MENALEVDWVQDLYFHPHFHHLRSWELEGLCMIGYRQEACFQRVMMYLHPLYHLRLQTYFHAQLQVDLHGLRRGVSAIGPE